MKWFWSKRVGITMLVLGMVALTSCLKNDIPYKIIRGNFTKFQVEGQTDTKIDTVSRTVTVNLSETTNIKKVLLLDYAITERETQVLTTTISPALTVGDYLDLSSPLYFTISTFQNYEWTVRAEQNIDIYFEVEGQIGKEVVDRDAKSVLLYVPEAIELDQIRVTRAKLGPSNATTTPTPTTITDFRNVQTFTVAYHDEVEEWKVRIMQTSVVVNTEPASAWARRAYLYGVGQSGEVHGFKYKKAAEATWIDVDPSLVESTGGTFTAHISGLEPAQNYVYKAISGPNEGEEVSFTTEAATVLDNGSFDDWHSVTNNSRQLWNPWAEGGNRFWDSGNKGATTVGSSNTLPDDELPPGVTSGQSARLASKFVGVAPFGKFAAGNLFVGRYKDTDGMNGILDFGQPFTSRPSRLKGKFKYTPGIVDYASSSNPDLSAYKNKNDTCSMYIALIDSDEPYEIRTKESVRQLFDRDHPSVIAYAGRFQGDPTSGWEDFTLELEYNAVNRVPKYLIIVCSASKSGDYFTGSTNSVLLLDEFVLEYD